MQEAKTVGADRFFRLQAASTWIWACMMSECRVSEKRWAIYVDGSYEKSASSAAAAWMSCDIRVEDAQLWEAWEQLGCFVARISDSETRRNNGERLRDWNRDILCAHKSLEGRRRWWFGRDARPGWMDTKGHKGARDIQGAGARWVLDAGGWRQRRESLEDTGREAKLTTRIELWN